MSTENPQEIIEVVVDGTTAKKGLGDIKESGRDMGADLAKSAQQAGKSIDAIGTSGTGAAQGVERATRSMTEAVKKVSGEAAKSAMTWGEFQKEKMGPLMRQFSAEGLPNVDAHTKAIRQIAEEWKAYKVAVMEAGAEAKRAAQRTPSSGGTAGPSLSDRSSRALTSQIEREIALLSAGERGTRKFYESLIQLRGGSVDAFAPLLAQLDAAREKQRLVQASMQRTGLSAKEMAFALRGVPAQFTDIATSLAAGQNPLTVFLQQGGQLKDMFGGVGAAARALGGYILGLINPLTIGAAVAGALGVAFFQGSKESQELAKSIILTGNAAGTTTGKLQDISRGVAEATGATRGAVAEALGQIVTTGKVTAANIGIISEAAIRMERATGQSIKETIKQFEELGRSPVEASIKLNEQAHYLTAELYRQIKALEDQGRATDAAALAQKAWADALVERSSSITGNLGSLEKAWIAVKDGAKAAWDSMLDVGRTKSVTDKLRETSDEIAALQARLARQKEAGGGLLNNFLAGQTQRALDEARATQSNLQEQARLESRGAARDKDLASGNAAGIELFKERDKYLTKEVQKRNELAKAEEIYKRAIAGAVGDQKLLAEYAAAYKQTVDGINEKFKEKKSNNNDIAQSFAAQLSVEKEFTKTEVALIKDRVKQRLITEEEGIDQELAAQERGYLKRVALLQEQIAKTKDKGEQDKLRGEITVAGLGMGEAVGKAQTERAKVADERLKSQQAFTASLGEEANALLLKAKAEEEENARIGMTKQQIAELTAKRYDEIIAKKEAAAEVARGAEGQEAELFLIEQQISALQRLKGAELNRPKLEERAAEIKELASLAGRGAKQIEDIFAENLFNGFSKGLKGMLQDFGQVIQRMIAQAIAADLSRRLLGSLGGSGNDWESFFSVLFGAGSASTGSSGGTFNGLQMRAEGGPVSAGHTYLVGEKGPEIVRMGGNGYVTPNNKVNWGGGEVRVVMNITSPDARSFAASRGQVAVAAQRAIARARRNM
jgi:phage-related minor tail protein